MMSYEEAPEFAGPVTEDLAGGASLDTQALAQHSIRLPRLDQAELAQGRFVPAHGPDPYRMSPEQVQRERDAAAAKYERRQRIESLVSSITLSTLEAGKAADLIEAEITEIADRASR